MYSTLLNELMRFYVEISVYVILCIPRVEMVKLKIVYFVCFDYLDAKKNNVFLFVGIGRHTHDVFFIYSPVQCKVRRYSV